MTSINPPYPPTEDVLRALRARAKTCGSNRVFEGDLLCEETCGAERMKQEEVLVMGIEAPGCPQEVTGTREFNEAILHLGCSATVAGKEWVREFEAKSGGTVEWFSTARRAFTGFTGEHALSDRAASLHV